MHISGLGRKSLSQRPSQDLIAAPEGFHQVWKPGRPSGCTFSLAGALSERRPIWRKGTGLESARTSQPWITTSPVCSHMALNHPSPTLSLTSVLCKMGIRILTLGWGVVGRTELGSTGEKTSGVLVHGKRENKSVLSPTGSQRTDTGSTYCPQGFALVNR